MYSLPQGSQHGPPHRPTPGESHGCGTSCGGGMEKIYPTTAVRYGAMSWLGEFKYRPNTVFKCGAKVVVETDRGTELGQQISLSCNGCSKQVTREQVRAYIDASGPEFYRLSSGLILREATPQDIDEARHLNAHVNEDIAHCAELARELGLDIKIVTCEHLLGGERVVFYFRSDLRVDFRALVRELAHHHRTRIEMRQVGARDEARLVADYEVCGRECCCKNFLKKLRPVTMRMAKIQKSTLDPSKVSGRCGRLRCCLRYEHIGYEELNAKLPPVGSLVETEFGPADVIDRQILTQLLLVRLADERQVTIPLEEVKAITLPRDRAERSVVPPKPDEAAEGDARARGPRDRFRRERPGGGPPPPQRERSAPEQRSIPRTAGDEGAAAPMEEPRGPGEGRSPRGPRPPQRKEPAPPPMPIGDASEPAPTPGGADRAAGSEPQHGEGARRGRSRRRRRRRGRGGPPGQPPGDAAAPPAGSPPPA